MNKDNLKILIKDFEFVFVEFKVEVYGDFKFYLDSENV